MTSNLQFLTEKCLITSSSGKYYLIGIAILELMLYNLFMLWEWTHLYTVAPISFDHTWNFCSIDWTRTMITIGRIIIWNNRQKNKYWDHFHFKPNTKHFPMTDKDWLEQVINEISDHMHLKVVVEFSMRWDQMRWEEILF